MKMPATIKNHMILDRFKELVNDYYTEPADEEILDSFLAISLDDSSVRTQKTPPFQRKNGQIQKKTYRVQEKCSVAK